MCSERAFEGFSDAEAVRRISEFTHAGFHMKRCVFRTYCERIWSSGSAPCITAIRSDLSNGVETSLLQRLWHEVQYSVRRHPPPPPRPRRREGHGGAVAFRPHHQFRRSVGRLVAASATAKPRHIPPGAHAGASPPLFSASSRHLDGISSTSFRSGLGAAARPEFVGMWHRQVVGGAEAVGSARRGALRVSPCACPGPRDAAAPPPERVSLQGGRARRAPAPKAVRSNAAAGRTMAGGAPGLVGRARSSPPQGQGVRPMHQTPGGQP